jgi:NAD(P)-dependent dehydrogenase (short-subunit alcohol dehydrogenase family)
MTNIFNLSDKTVFITGGAGFLGRAHAEAILEHGGSVVIADYDASKALEVAKELQLTYGSDLARSVFVDVTDKESIELAVSAFPSVNVLINNAAKNPMVSSEGKVEGAFETMTLQEWKSGIETCLDGTFLCSQVFCNKFVNEGGGVIINISSDLGVIAPDQRIYLNGKKPITYSASKFGVVGMTKYLATYFAEKNIRVNCLSPGGIYNNQPKDFVDRLTNLIPMGRMARKDEYKGAIVFLCSDASSYMTGENIVMNGGRAAW